MAKDRGRNHENPNDPAGQGSGCLVCGARLEYLDLPEEQTCSQCGRRVSADARCTRGHFVCDLCHKKDPLEVIRTICATSTETDMVRLMNEIRAHPCFAMHGPEHHSLVPGVILTTYRNLGGKIDRAQIAAAIDRGALLPGGACGYMGSCAAALGAGIAFATILGSTPLRPVPRSLSQKITAQILNRIADLEAARCCRRECNIVLTAAAELSPKYLPITLHAADGPTCDQFGQNRECPGVDCPLFPDDQE